jgi:hypothetical protein
MSSFSLQSAFSTSDFNPGYVKTLQDDSYVYDSGFYACPTPTEILCCFIQNDDPVRDMIIWAFNTGHNGGDVTHTSRKMFRGRVGMTLPTSNNTPVILQPTNGSNANPAPATAFVTASAAGLDGGTLSGFVPVTMPIAPEASPIDVGAPFGGFRIPPGGNAGCSCFMEADASTFCTEQFYVSWAAPNQL